MILIFNKVAPGFRVKIKEGDAQKNTTTLTVKGKIERIAVLSCKKRRSYPLFHGYIGEIMRNDGQVLDRWRFIVI